MATVLKVATKNRSFKQNESLIHNARIQGPRHNLSSHTYKTIK